MTAPFPSALHFIGPQITPNPYVFAFSLRDSAPSVDRTTDRTVLSSDIEVPVPLPVSRTLEGDIPHSAPTLGSVVDPDAAVDRVIGHAAITAAAVRAATGSDGHQLMSHSVLYRVTNSPIGRLGETCGSDRGSRHCSFSVGR